MDNIDVHDVESTVFVAVGPLVRESELTLLWAARSFPGKKLCLLHVHQPAPFLTFLDGRPTTTKFKQQSMKAFHELEVLKIRKLLHQYVLLLFDIGVEADKAWIQADNIEEGITNFICQHNVRWLVMGAAADKHYAEEMEKPVSKKALFVLEQAPLSCQIWFPCMGHPVYTRKRKQDGLAGKDHSPASSEEDSDEVTESEDGESPLTDDDQEEMTTVNHRDAGPILSSSSESGTQNENDSPLSFSPFGCGDEKHCEIPDEDGDIVGVTQKFTSRCSLNPTLTGSVARKAPGRATDAILEQKMSDVKRLKHEASEEAVERHQAEENFKEANGKARKAPGRPTDAILEQKMSDVKMLKHEAYEEAVERHEAEENFKEAKGKAEAMEILCNTEITCRKELEEALLRQELELERIRRVHKGCLKELESIKDQKPVLEKQIAESEDSVKELEEKFFSAIDLLKSFKKKRDDIRMECEHAIRDLERLRRIKEERDANVKAPKISSLSFSEINEVTGSFDPSKKIGDGRYGSVYQGVLCQVKVAIKMLPGDGSQDQWTFGNKVEKLSRVRHPNLVTLVGFSLDSRALIYEYVAQDSLEYHLDNSKFSNKALPWRTRIRIAYELCSLLIFLHSNRPPIIHGNLKPSKILLDYNFVCKVNGLGMIQLISSQLISTDQHAAATAGYVDPEFLNTGRLTPDSDMYSFGVILLRILTGKHVLGIVKEVQCALGGDKLESVLDSTAGNWPLHQAKELAYLATKCCETETLNRPDLKSELWTVLKSMRSSSFASELCSSYNEQRKAPSHFVCPIYQEVMKDPYTAADGFTYEGEAIKEWLKGGHKTSPLTNLKLEHCDLVPNHALYYAIQDWLNKP